MSDYSPISVLLVTCRLQGKLPPPELELARRFPCMECGAPVGMSCKETSDRCWRARLLSEKQWRAIQKAYRVGRSLNGSSGSAFLDSIYGGFNAMGMIHKDPDGAQDQMRRLRVGV